MKTSIEEIIRQVYSNRYEDVKRLDNEQRISEVQICNVHKY